MTTLWFRRVSGIGSQTMREIAREAGVDWDTQTIIYAEDKIGYADGDPADVEAIRDAAQAVIGVKPVKADDPRPLGTEVQ